MRIGLIDVDGHNFPNLPLTKLSAWHKAQGDSVEWYDQLFHSIGRPFDRVYMSKVFSFTPDYPYFPNAREIMQGGSGYAIWTKDGKEAYDKEKDPDLPPEIESIYPDYSIYYEKIPEVRDTAYGFLTRGCPRGCGFCHVGSKEGRRSVRVADLEDFRRDQKNVVILDPSITACRDWAYLFGQLIGSRAMVDFSQGLDIRLMTEDMANAIRYIRIKTIHFAWDRYGDGKEIIPRFKMFRETTGYDYSKMAVYILCNFDTTFEQDLERIYKVRDLGYSPYVMLYDKEHIPKGHRLRRLQGWTNNRIIFRSCRRFENYRADHRG